MLPLHPTATAALRDYLRTRARLGPTDHSAPFFLDERSGEALGYRAVRRAWLRLTADVGIVPRGGHQFIRIHDLRHTFICRRLMLWQIEGADIDNAMLALSTYVGHVNLRDTYWYLQAVPELNLRAGDVVLDVSPVAHLRGKGRKRRSVPLWKATAATLRQWRRHLPDAGPQGYLFPSSAGGRLSRSSAAQRLALAVAQAAHKIPALTGRVISPHTIRHTTAMHLLQSGVDITVIALWLGHEDPSTTHLYLEADLAMKESALSRLQPIATAPARYHPPDQLMAFLQSL